ncbi:hypothetical protein C8F04DRAFT_280625 [Mycena alexandri]|uniref:Carrier domain-containing protein n=1 Tax=Mycena alexandri TaxID=1745969 RepID=A0AAD6T6K9_9AGAR|nr:hypothetical protein C8F04DRAFT_280625 [Mycena alexandri]
MTRAYANRIPMFARLQLALPIGDRCQQAASLLVTMQPIYTPVPLDASLDILQAFAFQATKNPDHPLFRYDSESTSEGYEEITWSRAMKMFDTTAQILRHRLTKTDYTHSPVVGILAATSSIPYAFLLFGALRAGCTVFPLSTRNSDVATAHLIAESGIRYLLISSDGHMQEIARKTTALLEARSLHIDIIPIPTYDEISTTQHTDLEPLPPLQPIDDERVIMIAHSSGSTSFPKVIPFTHGHLRSAVKGLAGWDFSTTVRSAQGSAMFHPAGFASIVRAAYTGMTLAFFPPTTHAVGATPGRVMASAVATKCTHMFCPPMFLEKWAKNPADIEKLRNFTYVLFSGGPLAQSAGDVLEKHGVKLKVSYGTTEVAVMSLIFAKDENNAGWQYFQFMPTLSPVLVPVDGDSTGSLFQVIIKKSAINRLAVTNIEIDGVPAFDTKDIVQQHHTNPELYRVYGRVDDQIMHSTGEKTNPGPIEQLIGQNPLVKSSMLFGRSHPHAGVLVMPAEDVKDLESFRDALWPTLEQANKSAPSHSRLFKDMIILSDPSKPFQVTPKGTLRRNAILEDYAQEIEQAYVAFGKISLSSSAGVARGTLLEMKDALHIVRQHVHTNIGSNISDNEDIFDAGGDSLLAARIRTGIMRSLREPGIAIPDSMVHSLPDDLVFASPTIGRLASFVHCLMVCAAVFPTNGDSSASHTVRVSPLDQQETIVRFIEPVAGEPPLILIHAGSGFINAFVPLQTRFQSGLWAIQQTDEAPLTSFVAQTNFYYQKIKESQPNGPYRIGGYCAGTLMACRIAKTLEEHGNEVIQLALIDNSPLMSLTPRPSFDGASANFNDPQSLRDYYHCSTRALCNFMQSFDDSWWLKFSDVMWDRWNGRVRDEDMSELMRKAYHRLVESFPRAFEFMLSHAPGDPKGYPEVTAGMVKWMKEIRAPITVYKGSTGLILNIPVESRQKWWAFGMDWSHENVRVVEVPGNHKELLIEDQFLDDIQKF